MKTILRKEAPCLPYLIVSAISLYVGADLAIASGGLKNIMYLTDPSTDAEPAVPATEMQVTGQEVAIRSVEPDWDKPSAKKVTWFGVSVAEISASLDEKLGLRPGEGMILSYVAPDSPAARADLRRKDVLVSLDDQILVASIQLRKLIQMHKPGDSIRLVYYRDGRKQKAVARLEDRLWAESSPASSTPANRAAVVKTELVDPDPATASLQAQLQPLVAQSVSWKDLAVQQATEEARQTLEETRQAIRDALRRSQDRPVAQHELDPLKLELAAMAGAGFAAGKSTTIVVQHDGHKTCTFIQTDKTGCYVIIANPRKHLTVHDEKGKLLFDGPIETPEEQQKVPEKIWEKVKPLLMQMDRGEVQQEFVIG